MSLFNELKRRNVIRVAMAYVVAAWLIIQVVEITPEGLKRGDLTICIPLRSSQARKPGSFASTTGSSPSSAPTIRMRRSGSPPRGLVNSLLRRAGTDSFKTLHPQLRQVLIHLLAPPKWWKGFGSDI